LARSLLLTIAAMSAKSNERAVVTARQVRQRPAGLVPRHRSVSPFVACLLGSVLLTVSSARADDTKRDLTELDIEALMNLEVTSVSKKAEKSSEAAAALYVITAEDIRRSGATTIPDALRLAPGVNVAQVDANKWAVGVRGFTNLLNDKLLVLIDGRSVYTPLFGGVFWDVQDTLLDDVDRIEVIRGPGGTLWGANAVNGVINIITKTAKDTQGGLLTAQGGTQDRGEGAARYGGKLGDDFYYRVYAKYFNRDGEFTPGREENDGWQMGRTGFRTDWDMTKRDRLTFQGDYYEGRVGPFATSASPQAEDTVAGGNLLGRFTRTFASDSDISIQSYFDYTYRNDSAFREGRNTYDLDFQHRLPLAGNQELIWGLDYRVSEDDFRGSPGVDVVPASRAVQFYGGFLQDEIRLLDDKLRFTAGTKIEHNDFTGIEYQPSARVSWTPVERQTVWAAVSRAVRTPSRIEHDFFTETPNPSTQTISRATGNPDAASEKLVAYEAGYRFKPIDRVFLDLAVFYNDYTDLSTYGAKQPVFEPGFPGTPVIPILVANHMKGQVYGCELAADAQLTERWRLRGTYSYLGIDVRPKPGDIDPQTSAKSSPANQFSIRSLLDLPAKSELDLVFRYVDSFRAGALLGGDNGEPIPSYVSLDVHLAHRLSNGVEVSVVGQNLLSDHHKEFRGGTQVQRAAYGKVAWHF